MAPTTSTTVWTTEPGSTGAGPGAAEDGAELGAFLAGPQAWALGLPDPGALDRKWTLTALGAGGKTTLLHALGHAYAAAGARVALTTTTHLAVEPGLITDLDEALARLAAPGLVVAGSATIPGKVTSFGPEGLARLRAAADVLLVEGDGSRRIPFKVPAGHEPVIGEGTDLLIVVAGLSALGRPLDEVCFRVELARDLLSNDDPRALLDVPTAATLLRAGYLENPKLAGLPRIVVLNQADDAGRRTLGRALTARLDVPVLLTATEVAPSSASIAS